MRCIYRVTYNRIDWDKWFSGCANYYVMAEKFFMTKQEADSFVSQPIIEWVPDWKTNYIVKPPYFGDIEAIEI